MDVAGADEETTVRFTDRDAWRHWLSLHHGSADSLWVALIKKASDQPGLRYDEAVEEALCFGWIDGVMRSIDDDSFAQRFSRRRKRSIWSRTNKERIARLTAAGRMTASGLAAVAAARESGEWDAERGSPSAAGPLPVELVHALDRDPAARFAFDTLAPSHRAMYAGWVAEGKRAETRTRRAERVAALARRGEKPGIGTRMRD